MNGTQTSDARDELRKVPNRSVTLKVSEQLEVSALAAGISSESLLEDAIDAFLAQQPRRNAKGFIVPSFVGSVQSDDSSWIDRHEDLSVK